MSRRMGEEGKFNKHDIKPKYAIDVIILNLEDESTFCQEIVYLICF